MAKQRDTIRTPSDACGQANLSPERKVVDSNIYLDTCGRDLSASREWPYVISHPLFPFN